MTDTPAADGPADKPQAAAFTFGDPVPVLDGRDLAGLFQSPWNGTWYDPPLSFDGLARALPSNPHHQSCIAVKANILTSCFIPHRLLGSTAFKRLALDYLVFGNAYLEIIRNRLGGIAELAPVPARWTRLARDGRALMLNEGKQHWFEPGGIIHLAEPDISQEIYGLPSYRACLQSALLGEAATLFRRKYYLNGSHAGFILYMSDPAANIEDIDAIRDALKKSKGPGNFKNLFVYAPNGREKGLQVIPIAEVTARDEFLNVKRTSRDDVLAAHRVPPQLLGVPPENVGGFGDVEKAAMVFARHELAPLQATFRQIDDRLAAEIGEPLVRFQPYRIADAGDAAERGAVTQLPI